MARCVGTAAGTSRPRAEARARQREGQQRGFKHASQLVGPPEETANGSKQHSAGAAEHKPPVSSEAFRARDAVDTRRGLSGATSATSWLSWFIHEASNCCYKSDQLQTRPTAWVWQGRDSELSSSRATIGRWYADASLPSRTFERIACRGECLAVGPQRTSTAAEKLVREKQELVSAPAASALG